MTKFHGKFSTVTVELTEAGWEYLSKFQDSNEKLRVIKTMAEQTMNTDVRLTHVLNVPYEEVSREQEEQGEVTRKATQGEGCSEAREPRALPEVAGSGD